MGIYQQLPERVGEKTPNNPFIEPFPEDFRNRPRPTGSDFQAVDGCGDSDDGQMEELRVRLRHSGRFE
jgi:hypothetical protein